MARSWQNSQVIVATLLFCFAIFNKVTTASKVTYAFSIIITYTQGFATSQGRITRREQNYTGIRMEKGHI